MPAVASYIPPGDAVVLDGGCSTATGERGAERVSGRKSYRRHRPPKGCPERTGGGSLSRYGLGIDLGTTFTAAAVAHDTQTEMVVLGSRAAAIPSVIYVGPDGATLVGEPAVARAPSEPERIARA